MMLDLFSGHLIDGFAVARIRPDVHPQQTFVPIKEQFITKHHLEIEEKAKSLYIESQVKKSLERLRPRIRIFNPESRDPDEIAELLDCAENHSVPESLTRTIASLRSEGDLQNRSAAFFESAKVTNTIPRGLPGTKKLSRQYPDMIRLRYYKGIDGSIRRTVEVAIE